MTWKDGKLDRDFLEQVKEQDYGDALSDEMIEQILQDHEDAKLKPILLHDIELMRDYAKKREERCKQYKDSLDEFAIHIDEAIKDRQIVKRLEERIKKSEEFGNSIYYPILIEILEGEK